MTPAVYAERANADFGAARETAGFDSSKFDLMLSGSGVSAQWAAAVLRSEPGTGFFGHNCRFALARCQHIAGGTVCSSPGGAGGNGFCWRRDLSRGGRPDRGSVRRAGTSINAGRSRLSLAAEGSGQLAQSWGAGLAQTEHVLQMMAMGVRYQNGTVLTENSLHCADGSQAANCRSAQFLSDALANGVIGGTMLQTVQTGANPSRVQELSGNAVQAHALQSFAFAEGGKVSLVVFNLSPTAALPVTFSGNNAPAGDVQMAQIAPRDITNSNQNGAELQPSKQTLSDSDLSSGLSLPPYSMTVLSWEAGSRIRTAVPAVSGMVKVPSATANLTAAGTLWTAPAAASASTQPVINCPDGFTSASNGCGVANSSGGPGFFLTGTPNGTTPGLSGSQVILIPTGGTHTAMNLNYQTAVNVQAFTATYTFIPNGWNLAFTLNNNTNPYTGGNPANLPATFSAGAGCEGSFYQAFPSSGNQSVNNIFALELDQQDALTASNPNYTYSSVQIYSAGQSPCNPTESNSAPVPYVQVNKISTFPVPLNLSTGSGAGCPADTNGCNTTTGHTYSATITYDGSTVGFTLCDLTLGTPCFTNSWQNVNIPALVGGNTAFLGLAGGTNEASSAPLMVNSLVYTAGASAPTAVTPTFSVAAGIYATAQTVTISDTTSGATIYYTTNGTTPTTSSTKYTGPITVSATETLEAIAVASGYNNSAVASATYTISPTVPAPTFSPAGGTYTSTQTVTISDTTAGTTIYYTTNGTTPTTSSTKYTGPITVSATETLEAIAVAQETTTVR